MHCGSKRKRCPSLEHIDLEHQQHSLFDLSILKLQQEHLRHGVEPRLLRFVLINNALRTLQNHTNTFEEDNLVFECSEQGGDSVACSNQFLCNTFKHGGLSLTPVTPPTPAKLPRLDNQFTDQSPLVASTPFQGTLLDDISEFGEAATSVGPSGAVGSPGAPLPPVGVPSCASESSVKRTPSPAVNSLAVVVNQSCSTGSGDITVGSLLGKRKSDSISSGESTPALDDDVSSNGRVHPCVGEDEEEGCTDTDGKKPRLSSDNHHSSSSSNSSHSKPSSLHLNGFRLPAASSSALSNNLYPTTSSSSTSITAITSTATQDSSSSICLSSASLTPTTLTIPTPSHHHHHHHPQQQQQQHDSGSSEEDEYPSTPSPIDFTKVDPSIYDFDTRTTLALPGGLSSIQQEGPLLTSTASPLTAPTPPPLSSSSPSSSSSTSLEKPPVSCSMKAIVSAQQQNGDVVELNAHSRRLLATSEGLPGGVLSNGILPSPTADGAEPDFLEDLEHIVSLLMT